MISRVGSKIGCAQQNPDGRARRWLVSAQKKIIVEEQGVSLRKIGFEPGGGVASISPVRQTVFSLAKVVVVLSALRKVTE